MRKKRAKRSLIIKEDVVREEPVISYGTARWHKQEKLWVPKTTITVPRHLLWQIQLALELSSLRSSRIEYTMKGGDENGEAQSD